MPAQGWRWVRPGVALAVIAALLARFGAEPFGRGVEIAGGRLLAAGLVLTALATVCCAWRWRAVAAALGSPLDHATAFRACYGAQFLNATLPAGVLGDVDRAAAEGRRTGRPGTAARSVVWERWLGFAVQLVVTGVVVSALPGPLRPLGLVAAGVAAALAALTLLCLLPAIGRGVGADLRRLARSREVRVAAVPASLGVVACHTAVMLAALQAAGVEGGVRRTLPLALVVLLGATVPTSLAGWGPREGVAAWAFAVLGLPGSDGFAVSVAYGVTALVSTLPGAVTVLARLRGAPGQRRRLAAEPAPEPTRDPVVEPAWRTVGEGVRHG